jgi:hypothetical protein
LTVPLLCVPEVG